MSAFGRGLRGIGFGTRGQNELDGGRGRLTIEFDEADGCNFMRAKCWILRVQINDFLLDVRGKRPFILLGDLRWRRWWKQRGHPKQNP